MKLSQMSPASQFIHIRILPLVFILPSFCMLYIGTHGIYLSKESKKWPSAEGIILSSKIQDYKYSIRFSAHYAYHPEVLYQFKVAGHIYSGNKVTFSNYGRGYSYAQNIVDRYPKGKAIKVYYREDNPDINVLEPGSRGHLLLFLVLLGLIFLIGGCFLAVYLPKLKNKNLDLFRKAF